MEKHWTIITGASGSMGCLAAMELARDGFPVILACRDTAEGEALRQRILHQIPDATLEVCWLELASRTSIRAFVKNIGERRICKLFNNAGTISRHYMITADGVEQTMAVNYLGHYLLTRLLLPHFTPGANIVNMVSLVTKIGRLPLNWHERGERKFTQLGAYARSKIAFLYFSIALAQRYPQLRVNVSDPGIVNSDMIRLNRWFDPLTDLLFRPLIKTPQQGVRPAMKALYTGKRLRYFVGKKADPIPRRFTENPLVDALWEQAEKMLAADLKTPDM